MPRKRKVMFAVIGMAGVAVGLVFWFLCLPAIRIRQLQLVGEWKGNNCIATFEDDGEVWIEEQRSGFSNGKRAKYAIQFSKVKIEGMGVAKLLRDGDLYLDVRFSNRFRNTPGVPPETVFGSRIKTMLHRVDSSTIACEVPIWLWEKNLDLGISGHIDLLQIRQDKIFILDFKPGAQKENEQEVASQLFWYASGLSFRTSIPLKDFTCAWFDDQVYFEFDPVEVKRRFRFQKP